jgi:hypothetical protein
VPRPPKTIRAELTAPGRRAQTGFGFMHARGIAMAISTSQPGAFRTVCLIAAIIGIVYGLGFLLMPEIQLQMSQDPGVPANAGWVRWAGATLIGIAVAVWLAARDPAKQRPLICGAAVGYTLIALSLLYSLVSGEYKGLAWYIWTPIVINAALAAAMWWLTQQYKAVL